MATKYMVRVANTGVDPRTGHETSVRCTCGWSMTVSGPTAEAAVRLASRTREDHLQEAHPGQVLQRGAVLSAEHDLLIGGPSKKEHLWTRHAVCACSWTTTVTERSPDRVAALVRARHRAHLVHETGRAPVRDYLVMLGLLVVVAAVLLALFTSAIQAGGR